MADIIYILLSIAVYIVSGGSLRIASLLQCVSEPQLSLECDEWCPSYLPRLHEYVQATPM